MPDVDFISRPYRSAIISRANVSVMAFGSISDTPSAMAIGQYRPVVRSNAIPSHTISRASGIRRSWSDVRLSRAR